MAVKMIEVEHEGIEGTATVPETALRHMAKGWKPVKQSTDEQSKPKKRAASSSES